MARRLSRLHTALYRISRGRIGKRLVDNDMLLLTTHGRRTARSHTVPLLFLAGDESFVVIASWGGRDRHPDWYHNLLDEPMAMATIRAEKKRVLARIAGGPERDVWWGRAVAAHSGYSTYQELTDREIPVVILEPLER
jgi:deazaflavin-dependent oxidoreductase (nitroreductase family)